MDVRDKIYIDGSWVASTGTSTIDVFDSTDGSVILSGVMMFEHLGWQDVADDIVRALETTIGDKIVTYDFARQMDGAHEVKCSEFAQAIVDRL